MDGGFGPSALVGRPADVPAGVLASQRLDRQRRREFVDQTDAAAAATARRCSSSRIAASATATAGQRGDDLAVERPADRQRQSAFHHGALQGQPLAGVEDGRVGHRHNMRRIFFGFVFPVVLYVHKMGRSIIIRVAATK